MMIVDMGVGNMKQQSSRASRWLMTVGLIAALVVPSSALAAPVAYTDLVSWQNAITAINAPAVFGLEDWNSEAVTAGDGLGAGPHGYGGGDFNLTLNDIGNGGSQTGIVTGADAPFDGSNAFEMRAVHDSSDFSCCGGFVLLGEGFESMDGLFATSVLGLAADFTSTTTHDGLIFQVSGIDYLLHDYYPDSNLEDGDGFLGIVDSAGIMAFAMLADDQDPGSSFEQAQMDNFRWAHEGVVVPPPAVVPVPAAVWLFGTALIGLVGFSKRRRSEA